MDVSTVKASAALLVGCAVAIGVISGLVLDETAQADSKTTQARIRRKITFSIKNFMTESFERMLKIKSC